MPDLRDSADVLQTAIRDGTFPDSDELLTSELSTNNIPSIVDSISTARRQLEDEISAESKTEAENVDIWIEQAKRIQEDIARCKIEAKQIVEDHHRLEAFNTTAADANAKVGLLEYEIYFTEALQDQLQGVATMLQSVRDVDYLLQQGSATKAAQSLKSIKDQLSMTTASTAKSLCFDIERELANKTRASIESALKTRFYKGDNNETGWFEIKLDGPPNDPNFESLIDGLDRLGFLPEVVENLTEKVERFVLPFMRGQSKFSYHSVDSNVITVHFGSSNPSVDEIVNFAKDFLAYLHSNLPLSVQNDMVNRIIPKVVSILITDWLNLSIPSDLSQLTSLDNLQHQATSLADQIESFGWQGYADLEDWVDQAPRIWLTRRKANTLNAVRKALTSSKGTLRQVERVEKQAIPANKQKEDGEESNEWNSDWNADGREDAHSTRKIDDQEEDASGWGFDDDDEDNYPGDNNTHYKQPGLNGNDTHEKSNAEEDAEDAWGWGDETEAEQKTQIATTLLSGTINGTNKSETELILKETYSITDIPDGIVEIIEIDLQDSKLVENGSFTSLDGIPAAAGLLTLSTLALAMFRAAAPTHYTSSSTLSNMQLYNDSSYIVQKLRDIATMGNTEHFENDCKVLEKFARSAYAREMETQRIILNDLLDGAQGFTSSTKFPYSQEIENAVSSTVDRIRIIHQQWQPILSTSALLQSVGALVSTVISKIISDVEEMDDISEPESHRLNEFCSQVNALEELFVARPPGTSEDDSESLPMTAVYVSSWLRFQYLTNILESSLVDIKFLWTEGELSLEFTQDEVIDLIKALFADSPHRRSAISAIRGHRSSGS